MPVAHNSQLASKIAPRTFTLDDKQPVLAVEALSFNYPDGQPVMGEHYMRVQRIKMPFVTPGDHCVVNPLTSLITAQKELANHIPRHTGPPDQRAPAFTRPGPGASRFSGPHETHSLVG